MSRISRQAYADMFGPTTGGRVRLGDSGLFLEVEADRTVYGDEVKFGGGKVIRDSMGQSQADSDAATGALPANVRRLWKDRFGDLDVLLAPSGCRGGCCQCFGIAKTDCYRQKHPQHR